MAKRDDSLKRQVEKIIYKSWPHEECPETYEEAVKHTSGDGLADFCMIEALESSGLQAGGEGDANGDLRETLYIISKAILRAMNELEALWSNLLLARGKLPKREGEGPTQ